MSPLPSVIITPSRILKAADVTSMSESLTSSSSSTSTTSNESNESNGSFISSSTPNTTVVAIVISGIVALMIVIGLWGTVRWRSQPTGTPTAERIANITRIRPKPERIDTEPLPLYTPPVSKTVVDDELLGVGAPPPPVYIPSDNYHELNGMDRRSVRVPPGLTESTTRSTTYTQGSYGDDESTVNEYVERSGIVIVGQRPGQDDQESDDDEEHSSIGPAPSYIHDRPSLETVIYTRGG